MGTISNERGQGGNSSGVNVGRKRNIDSHTLGKDMSKVAEGAMKAYGQRSNGKRVSDLH
jgi:hypothetical protein